MPIRQLVTVLTLCLLASPASAQFASDHDRREAIQHYRNGQELLSTERFEKAAEEFERAIDKDRLLTLAHYGLGQAHMAMKRYASAVLAFTGCREAFQTLHGLHERDRIGVERQREEEIRELKDTLRRLRLMQNTNIRQANVEAHIQDLERQRTSNQGGFVSPPEVSLSLGSAHFRSGDLEAAEREWKAAVAVNSKMGEAHNNLAVLHMMQGRRKEAEEAVRAAEKAGFRVNPNLKADIRKMQG